MKTRITRLLALSDAEFGEKRQERPKRQTFKALNVNLVRLDKDWERQRGAAARMMAVILKEDSESLYAKVIAKPKTIETFADAVGWLNKEAQYLRKLANRLEIAATRLSTAVARHKASQAGAAASAPQAAVEGGAP